MNIVIIGAGPAGLYSSYLLHKKYPNSKITIIEKENYPGGRTRMVNYEGVDIVTGAGIGRKEKDILLQRLLKNLGFIVPEYPSHHYYIKGIKHTFSIWVKKLFANINKVKRMPFRAFGIKTLGESDYKKFVIATAYGDFEAADCKDVMQYDGFADHISEFTILKIPWNDLINKLSVNENIIYNTTIIKINKDKNEVIASNNKTYKYDKLIVATTIDSIKHLFPEKSIYSKIKGEPFLRMYGKFSDNCINIVKNKLHGRTVVGPPLQEIIPMNPDKGVYMISYSDNKNAIFLKNKNKTYFEQLLSKILDYQISLDSIQSHFWKIGIHYNLILPAKYTSREEFMADAQMPYDNIFIVGEVVALDHGWTESALETVESIINKI